jgi:hypothetical protein
MTFSGIIGKMAGFEFLRMLIIARLIEARTPKII